MLNLIAPVATHYLMACGLATAAAVTSRGLVRAARLALRGDRDAAVVEALGAVAAPAVVAIAAVSGLVAEVADAAGELAGDPLAPRAGAAPEPFEKPHGKRRRAAA